MTQEQAYHFLRADMKSGQGNELPWPEGEERTITGKLVLCERGYHSSPTPWHALAFAPGPVLCLVEISEPVARETDKQVSATRKLVKAVNIDRELRLFAADEAERVLYLFERQFPGDDRPRKAIQVARDCANGQIGVAAGAARVAARAARTAARAAARAAGAAEAAWVAAAAWAAGDAAAAWDAAAAEAAGVAAGVAGAAWDAGVAAWDSWDSWDARVAAGVAWGSWNARVAAGVAGDSWNAARDRFNALCYGLLGVKVTS